GVARCVECLERPARRSGEVIAELDAVTIVERARDLALDEGRGAIVGPKRRTKTTQDGFEAADVVRVMVREDDGLETIAPRKTSFDDRLEVTRRDLALRSRIDHDEAASAHEDRRRRRDGRKRAAGERHELVARRPRDDAARALELRRDGAKLIERLLEPRTRKDLEDRYGGRREGKLATTPELERLSGPEPTAAVKLPRAHVELLVNLAKKEAGIEPARGEGRRDEATRGKKRRRVDDEAVVAEETHENVGRPAREKLVSRPVARLVEADAR